MIGSWDLVSAPAWPMVLSRSNNLLLAIRSLYCLYANVNVFLGITLVSIVLMHLLCNALRVFLGVMVVVLVGKLELNVDVKQ